MAIAELEQDRDCLKTRRAAPKVMGEARWSPQS
jgi:hypothetical protein